MSWQPIDTAPKDGTDILAVIQWHWSDGDHAVCQSVIRWYSPASSWIFKIPCNYIQLMDDGVVPTHWMPLPELPQ